ncbi:MAG: DUF4397 domain-containing protein [Actinomycetia bacterium]|nr:DUF4397 domain-containing protein [Actinomycetes bacterium]
MGRTSRTIPALIVALGTLLVGLVASPALGQTETGFLTAVNASTETIDIYIDDQLAGIRLEPGQTGREFSVPTGAHTVSIYPTGTTPRSANLLAQSPAQVLTGSGTSVVTWGAADSEHGVGLQAFPNPAPPDSGRSCVVLRHLANAGPTQLLIDGEPSGDRVGNGSTSRSIPVDPGLVELGLDGLDSTPAQADLVPGSCVAVHAVGGQDVIINLVVQPLASRGDGEIDPPAGPARIEVVNGLRGLAVDFLVSEPDPGQEPMTLAPLSANTSTHGSDTLEARFVDHDGTELGQVSVALIPGDDLTVALHGDTNGEPIVTVFDNTDPALDDNTACVDVRVLATAGDPVGVVLENGPSQIGLGAGESTGPLGADSGPTVLTVGPTGAEISETRELEGGVCLRLYLVDTADGLQLVDGAQLEAGLAGEAGAEVAGRQETLPVTGWGDTAPPLVLFALGVITFGIGLLGRSREQAESEPDR